MDMVCAGGDGFDPENDPISLLADREAGTLRADGTSLGADDGVEPSLSVTVDDADAAEWALDDQQAQGILDYVTGSVNGVYTMSQEVAVEAIHAALECGAFSELSPALDMASIGPDVTDVHSTDETLYLNSIPKIWHLLEELPVSLN